MYWQSSLKSRIEYRASCAGIDSLESILVSLNVYKFGLSRFVKAGNDVNTSVRTLRNLFRKNIGSFLDYSKRFVNFFKCIVRICYSAGAIISKVQPRT